MSRNEHFRLSGYGFDCRASRTLMDMMFIKSTIEFNFERTDYETSGDTP